MNDGVKILIERMKTNPEEFGGVHSKWNHIISEHIAFLEEDIVIGKKAEVPPEPPIY